MSERQDIRLAGFRANIKGGYTLVAMFGQFSLYALGLTLGINYRSPADGN